MNNQEKTELAINLNKKYNEPGRNAEALRELWDSIASQCEEVGIEPDLIQISTDVFDLLVKHNTIHKYFKKPNKPNHE